MTRTVSAACVTNEQCANGSVLSVAQRVAPPSARSDALRYRARLGGTVRQPLSLRAGRGSAGTFVLVMAATTGVADDLSRDRGLYLGELEDSGREQRLAPMKSISRPAIRVLWAAKSRLYRVAHSSRAPSSTQGSTPRSSSAAGRNHRYGKLALSGTRSGTARCRRSGASCDGSSLTDRYAKERSYDIRFISDTEYEIRGQGQRLSRGQLGNPVQVPGARLTLVAGSERKPKPGTEYTVTVGPLQEVTDATLDALQVSAPKPLPGAQPVNVVTLEFRGPSPRLAARFLEYLMAAYLNERQAWKAEDATAAEAFVTNQLKKTRETLDDLQKKLADTEQQPRRGLDNERIR